MLRDVSSIKTVALAGTGTIGAAWAAKLTNRGLNVIAFDKDPCSKDRLFKAVETAELKMNSLIAVAPENKGMLVFTDSLEEALEKADYVQENAPDVLSLKIDLIERISRLAPPDVVIASSSSNLKPTDIQKNALYPERVLIGHPFNPVYICPLVEIVCGEKTSAEAYDIAYAFYSSIGMKPLRVQKEVEGYIANRLQEAMWREILYLVRDGVATPKDIDSAIIYSFGIRLAFMGTCLTFHLSAGEGGMDSYLHGPFGATIKDPLSYLIGPDLTEDLIEKMISGVGEMTEGKAVAELAEIRDDCMIAIINALSGVNYAAGKLLNEEKAVLTQKGLIKE